MCRPNSVILSPFGRLTAFVTACHCVNRCHICHTGLPCVTRPRTADRKSASRGRRLRLSKKWLRHFFEKDSLRSAPRLPAESGQFDARSAQSVFCHAHVAAENQSYLFRACGRETLRGFFDKLKRLPREALLGEGPFPCFFIWYPCLPWRAAIKSSSSVRFPRCRSPRAARRGRTRRRASRGYSRRSRPSRA